MTRREINLAREKVLAKVLLRRFRSFTDGIALPELAGLFEQESLCVAAKFFTYAAFSSWVAKHPDLTVETSSVRSRGLRVLVLDTPAAMFVGSRTGESLTIDFEALRESARCEPVGDFSYMENEARP